MANGIKAQIVAPDVGQADCFLIQLYQDAQVFNLLIDGGSRYDLNWSLIDFLGMHHVTHLDVMILTHMHQDHIGQIDRIAAQFTVSAAVFPYPASQLMPPYPAVFEQERRDDTGTCIRAQAILKEQHTKLYFTFGNPRPTVFIFGKYKLECLFPTGNESSVLELLGEMRDSTADKQKEQYQQLCSNLNGDSSIWLLTYAGDDLALFCGDCLAQHLDKVLLERTIHPYLIKLSHHGRNDKGKIYFNEKQLETLAPKKMLLSTTGELAGAVWKKEPYLQKYHPNIPACSRRSVQIQFD